MVLNTPLSHKLSIYYYNTDVCKDSSDYESFKAALKSFTIVILYHVGQKPLDVQWRNREKRGDNEHHEKVSFFHLAEF